MFRSSCVRSLAALHERHRKMSEQNNTSAERLAAIFESHVERATRLIDAASHDPAMSIEIVQNIDTMRRLVGELRSGSPTALDLARRACDPIHFRLDELEALYCVVPMRTQLVMPGGRYVELTDAIRTFRVAGDRCPQFEIEGVRYRVKDVSVLPNDTRIMRLIEIDPSAN